MANARMTSGTRIGGQQQQQVARQRKVGSPFMKLPAEVRMMIYRYAFSGLRLWIRHVHLEKGDFRACFEQSSRGLLRTSKLIRMESLPLLYHSLSISCTYRIKRQEGEGDQWVDFPFYSRQAVNALQQATTISLDREIYKCYDRFGSMFRHCSRLQHIELCIIASKGYSQDVGHDRPQEFQGDLEEACEVTTRKLLERCKEKIAKNMRHGGAEEETDKQESEDNMQRLVVERVSVKPVGSLSFRGLICFKTTTRFRICLDGAKAEGRAKLEQQDGEENVDSVA